MNKDLKLKKNDIEALESLGIEESGILLSSPIDLSFSGEYIEGFIAVTAEKVVICTKELPEGHLNIFKGVTVTDDLKSEELAVTDTNVYEISELAHLRLDTYIGSNVLSASYKGVPTELAAFTNRYSSEMNVLFRKLKGFLKGEEITQDEENTDEAAEDIEEKKKKSKRSIFFRTLKYFLKYKLQIFVLFLTYLTSAALSIAWPYLTGKVLFDHVLEKDDVFLARFGMDGRYVLALGMVALTMIGVKVIQSVSNYFQVFFMAKVAAYTVRDIKTDVFDSMSGLSLNFFVNKQTGGLMTRVLSDS